MTHIEKATDLFGRNFHCSQSVFAAFSEELGITEFCPKMVESAAIILAEMLKE